MQSPQQFFLFVSQFPFKYARRAGHCRQEATEYFPCAAYICRRSAFALQVLVVYPHAPYNMCAFCLFYPQFYNVIRIKRFLIGSLLAALLLLGGAVLLLKIYEEEVKAIVITELNTSLLSPIQVGGEIYLSLFEHFPAVSLSFRQLQVDAVEMGKPAGYTLAAIDRLSLSFSLLDLLRGRYELHQLSLSDAQIDLRFDQNGLPNFLIWKNDSSGTVSNASFAIRKLSLQRVKMHYSNAADQQDISASFTDADFKGDFRQRNFRLQARATLAEGSLTFNNKSYLDDRPLELAMALEVDLDQQQLRFTDSRVELNREKLVLNGYHRWNNPQQTELNFEAAGFDAEELLSYFRHENAFLQALALEGELSLSGSIALSATDSRITIQSKLRDVHVGYSAYQLSFTGQTDARAAYSRAGGLQLHFDNIRLSRKNEKISGSLAYTDQSSWLQTNLMGNIRLEQWQILWDSLALGAANGAVVVDKLKVGFKIGDKSWPKVETSLRFTDVDWRYGDNQLTGLNGNAQSLGDGFRNLRLTELRGGWNSRKTQGQLQLYNYPALFLNEEGRYSVSGEVEFDQFEYQADTNNSTTSSESNNLERMDVRIKTPKFTYNDYVFETVDARLSGHPDQLRVQLYQTKFAQGIFRGDLNWRSTPEGYTLQGALNGDGAGMKTLFTRLNNFDQDFLTDKNIDGKLNFTSTLELHFDKNYHLLLPRLRMTTTLKLADGNLLNFAPMQALSKFVDAGELRNLRFSELNNRIDISESRISIPNMAINTNAAAFNISGEHLFDNSYIYYVKLSLSDLWAKKQKKINFDPALAEVNLNGGVNLYIVIKGKGSDFTVTYDKLSVKTKLKEAAVSSSKDIGRLLREEFSGEGSKVYENNNVDAFTPIEAEADTLVVPKEPEFDPTYLRKPKSRKDAFKRDKG